MAIPIPNLDCRRDPFNPQCRISPTPPVARTTTDRIPTRYSTITTRQSTTTPRLTTQRQTTIIPSTTTARYTDTDQLTTYKPTTPPLRLDCRHDPFNPKCRATTLPPATNIPLELDCLREPYNPKCKATESPQATYPPIELDCLRNPYNPKCRATSSPPALRTTTTEIPTTFSIITTREPAITTTGYYPDKSSEKTPCYPNSVEPKCSIDKFPTTTSRPSTQLRCYPGINLRITLCIYRDHSSQQPFVQISAGSSDPRCPQLTSTTPKSSTYGVRCYPGSLDPKCPQKPTTPKTLCYLGSLDPNCPRAQMPETPKPITQSKCYAGQ